MGNADYHGDVLQAASALAHEYKGGAIMGGGVPAMARAIGKGVGTFYNELNPDQPGHKLGLEDGVLMERLANDHRILHTHAQALGEVCFPIPDFKAVSDEALLDLVLKVGERHGEMAKTIRKAWEDGAISEAEYGGIDQAAYLLMGAVVELRERMGGLVNA